MQRVIQKINECEKCELHKTVQNKVIGKGSKSPLVLFIGEAPGKNEDETGLPFCGASGKMLDKWIQHLGLEGSDYAVINCLKCRPPENADPTKEQLEACREWLIEQIVALNPKAIFYVGRYAAKEVGGFKEGITSLAGKVFVDGNSRYHIPFPHPSYYLRKGGYGWEDSLSKVRKGIENKIRFEKRCVIDKETVENFSALMMHEIESYNPESYSEVEGFDGVKAVGMRQVQGYVPLHLHTTYSITDSCTKLDKLAANLASRGFSAAAITDHGTIGGWYEFQTTCEENNIKPLLGIEFYVAKNYTDKNTYREHLVAIAKGPVGIKSIFKLNDIAHRHGFYYKPRITIEDFIKYGEDLIVLSACTLGVISQRILNESKSSAMNMAKTLKDNFDFYLELQPHDFEEQYKVNPVLIEISQKLDIPLVVTMDSHYIDKRNKQDHDALKAIAFRKEYGEGGFTIDTNYIPDDVQLLLEFKEAGIDEEVVEVAMENTIKIAEKCNARLERYKNTIPKVKRDE